MQVKRDNRKNYKLNKITLSSLIITLGIVYGDIGTSPLYVIKAIGHNLPEITTSTILGGVSCVFWTLTLQTTLKYIIITLRANNKGEGGIFALFALLRKRYNWAYVIAIIGGSALLADGIITPAITVSAAVEGLRAFHSEIPTVLITLIILGVLFFIQQFGTSSLGKSFGPVMVIWFLVIAGFGTVQIIKLPLILKAINPYYALQLLTVYPKGFLILGAVFLATTGAEALYSDLGHCGIRNIRITWIYVKIALLLSYFGQSAWFINHSEAIALGKNPFFAVLPSWFIVPGILIASMAAVIASQALISGSFTLISEAMSLNFWPKMTIKYPTEIKGQIYLPAINLFLWIACSGVVLLFRESSAMEAAYGLAITITMLMTTILLILHLRRFISMFWVVLLAFVFFTIEGNFLYANLHKIISGGWFALILAFILFIMMYAWYNGRRIKNQLMSYVPFSKLQEILMKVSEDETIPKFATNLIYITKTTRKKEIESTLVYSLLNKQPKRADIYWFIHIETKDNPYTTEYEVTHIVPGKIIKLDIHLGFRIEPRINLLFRQVLNDLSSSGEIKTGSRYPSQESFAVSGDYRYILIDRILTADHQFNVQESLIMTISNVIRKIGISEDKALHLDASNMLIEKVPLGKPDILPFPVKRIF
ncbi:MAG: KUP/HAK/KT family potassium transporter [Bacteroidales bacterium]|nr:KUP/HAK/KT family potassium transporter [Bacteroidales bacterium]